MSTLAEKLRIACEANGLGVSGSSSVLLARLVKGGKTEKKRPKGKKTNTSSPKKKKMVCKNGVCKPMKTSPVKVTNKPGYMTFAKTGAPNSRTTQVRRPTPNP